MLKESRDDAFGLLQAADAELTDSNLRSFVATATLLMIGGSLLVSSVLLATGEWERLRGTLPFSLVGIVVAILQKRGSPKLASRILVCGVWACSINSLLWTQGLSGTTIGALILSLAFAGWITGPCSAALLSAATVPVIFVFAYLEAKGWIFSQQNPVTPLHRALVLSFTALGAGGLGYFGASSHRDRLIKLFSSESNLKQRVAELTEREEALQESEARFRLLASSTFEGILIGENGRVVDANEKMLTMLGYSSEEFVGMTVEDVVVADDREQVWKNIRSGSEVWLEMGLIRKDGQHIIVESHGKTSEIRGRKLRLNAMRDITERKRLEKRLNMAINVTQALFWEYDVPTGRLLYDRSALHWIGLEADDVLDSIGGWIERIHPDERLAFHEKTAQALQQEGTTFNFEYRIADKTGEYHWIRTLGRLLERSSDGSPLLAVGTSMSIDAQKRAEAAIMKSESLHRSIVHDQTEFIARCRADKSISFINETFAAFLGMSVAEIVDRKWDSFVNVEDTLKVEAQLRTLNPESPVATIECQIHSGNGELRWMLLNNRGFFDEFGQMVELQSVGRDITDRKKAEKALQDSEIRFRGLFESMQEGFLLHDVIYDASGKPHDLRVLDANPAYYKTIGNKFGPIELIGAGMRDLFPHVSEAWLQGAILVAQTGESRNIELKSGVTDRWYHVHCYSPHPGQAASLVSDHTERKRAEDRIHYLAYRDALTELPNRALLKDRVEQSIANASRENSTLALLFLDLDQFKNINDSLGHAAGDSILKELATRLPAPLREMDTVGRLGGDEFLIVLPGADGSAAAHVAQKLLAESRRPYLLESRSLTVTPSVGIALYPKDGADFDALLKAADTAMYRAKDDGRDTYRFYTEAMNHAVFQRMELESNLHRAIDNDELLLHYQPKFDLDSRRLVGVEALIRWKHESLGMVPPAQFIPVAEASGLIVAIGKWVLEETCGQIKEWNDLGLPPVRVAINFSTRQFAADNIVEIVTETLQAFGLKGDVLELEITESLLAQDTSHTLQILQSLKQLGVHIAIDDFGTGYSSLSYLKRFPIDRLKIDHSFVRDLEVDADDRAIATAVVTLGHSLEMRVIAEGVETAKQIEILRAMGCDEIQGFYLGRPIPANELTALLRSHSVADDGSWRRNQRAMPI